MTVKVIPRSSVEGISREEDGLWKLRVNAPAVDGKANNALISILSKNLGIPKKDIEIVSGQRSRIKRIRLSGIDSQSVERLLSDPAVGRRRAANPLAAKPSDQK